MGRAPTGLMIILPLLAEGLGWDNWSLMTNHRHSSAPGLSHQVSLLHPSRLFACSTHRPLSEDTERMVSFEGRPEKPGEASSLLGMRPNGLFPFSKGCSGATTIRQAVSVGDRTNTFQAESKASRSPGMNLVSRCLGGSRLWNLPSQARSTASSARENQVVSS